MIKAYFPVVNSSTIIIAAITTIIEKSPRSSSPQC
jgi:hypothetical protein